jgi:hypothetical protein
MKYLAFLLSILIFSNASSVMADAIVMDKPKIASTLPFADRYASAFYIVDRDYFNVVIAFAAGVEGSEQLIRQRIQLADGQTYRLSIGGYGDNEQATTISMTRKKDVILADVMRCESRETMAKCN